MKVAIVGTGNMGGAIGVALAQAGHEIRFSDVRTAGAAERLAERTGAIATTPESAVDVADAVIIAVPPVALAQVVSVCGGLSGSTVLSVSSQLTLDPSGQQVGLPCGSARSVAEELARLAPRAAVVQTFTCTFAELIQQRGANPSEVTPTMPVVADDDHALSVASQLVADAGFEPIALRGLRFARATETLATAFAQFAVVAGIAPKVGFRVLEG